jgi:hypothetical protein
MIFNPSVPTIYLSVADADRPSNFRPSDGDMRPMEVFAFLTVAWVVEVLAGAVLSWLAKFALDSLLAGPNGSGGISPQQLYDLFQKVMREALSEYDIQLLSRRYQAVVEAMLEYKASGGVHRLDDADLQVNELIVGFKTYGDVTADLLASAEMLKIVIYQTYMKEKIRDESANIQRQATEFKVDLIEAAARRLRLIKGYYSGPIIKYPGHGEMAEYGFTYKGDFGPVWPCWPTDAKCHPIAWQKAEEAMARHLDAEIAQRYSPFEKAIDVLDKLSKHPKP